MLEGLKVIELATYVAAPGAGALMADWGADVVKVEAPAGDPFRQFLASASTEATINPVFEFDNRGKRSVVLDIKRTDAAEALRALIGSADVFLTNVRPATLARSNLDWTRLSAEYPRLIYASVSGYGLTGDDADRAAFDHTAFWARAGVTGAMTPAGHEPPPPGTGVGDHICAIATVAAVLAALIERDRTGKGKLVETSLLRAGTYVTGTNLALQLQRGRLPSPKPRTGAPNPLTNFFKAGDGRWFCLAARQASKDWADIARATRLPGLIADPCFATARARKENGAALVALLDEVFAALTLEQIAERLDAADVVWAPVLTPAEVVNDPQAIAAGCFQDARDASGEAFRSPAGPARFNGAADNAARPAPRLGQHTSEVLSALGYSPMQIARVSGDEQVMS